MKLAEALKIVQTAPPEKAERFSVYLACGYLPLHLATFLEANLRTLLPERSIEIQTGLYGDMAGNLDRLRNADALTGVVVFEWADFDPRLGLRSLGGWGPNALEDIPTDVQLSSERFLQLLNDAAETKPLAVCLPTLPLPPLSHHPEEQAGWWQLRLSEVVSGLALRASGIPNIKILNQRQLDKRSPLTERLDVKSEFASGFPYRIAHASTLAEMLALLVQPRPPRKGLITDLDDTFWRGLLGEDGVAGISWSLDQNSHIHALYQQTLLALSESGVLIGVSSKNDHALAVKAFERDDIVMPRERLFPFEVNWSPKSESVGRILQVWNVAADSVVFVDDSPMELAEVKAAFPEMECLLFPKGDDQAAYDLLEDLRDLFGKESILEEDAIRHESIRRSPQQFRDGNVSGASADPFLARVEAELTLNSAPDPSDERASELINKTNQFNLNGRRLTRSEFRAKVDAPNAFFLLVAYKDKYGPLGKIAVMLGSLDYQHLKIDTWVMSCRAFSRRIEHKCLEYIFDKLEVTEITFDFQPTERNAPLREFLSSILGNDPARGCSLDRETFMAHKPMLHHTIKELIHA
jgi:FkbH-like protein